MLRSPRASLFVTAFCLVYAAVTTFIILNGSSHGGWLDRLVPSLGDPRPPSSLEQHTVILEKDCTPLTTTATRTVTAVETVIPAPAGPGYCHECGADDVLCKEYGQHNLQRSRGFEGSNARLKRILRKAASGQPINIGVLGGSVTHGHGVVHPEYWTDIFFTWWNTTYPHEKNVFVNGAVPATGTDYFSVCAFEHIDQDVDLVIIEMSINDLRNEDAAKSYEWLLRLLLQLPSQPAIINAHVMSIFFEYLATGGDYHLAVAQYYDTPVVSLRHVLLNHLLEHNNLVHEFFHAYPPAPQDWPPDLRHINRVGHKMMADLLIAYMQRVTCQIAAEDAHPVEPFVSSNGLLPTIEFMERVPRLRLFQGYAPDVRVEHVESTCLSMRSKKHPLQPSHTTGWSEWSWKDKSYLVGREPGAVVTFDIHVGPMGVIKLEYLRSKAFGMGMVRCWVGEDNGGGETFDGYWEEPLNIARGGYIIQGYNPGPAQVSCKILEKTNDPSGGHEFRLIALTSH